MIKERVRSQEADVEKLEKIINCGQIEEVIFQVGPWCFFQCRPSIPSLSHSKTHHVCY